MGRVCDGCGKPPRSRKDGSLAPLRQCTRCKSAWYHDSSCQRAHFPRHKAACLEAKNRTKDSVEKSIDMGVDRIKSLRKSSSQARVVQKEGRGRCLVSLHSIKPGSRILNAEQSNKWKALIPPVLRENLRTARCALCFKILLEEMDQYLIRNPQIPQYELRFCSSACKIEGNRQGFDLEMMAVEKICGGDDKSGPPRIFSTAILLFRLMRRAYGSTKDKANASMDQFFTELNELQDSIEEESDDAFHHTRAVIATSVAMCRSMPGILDTMPSMPVLVGLLSKIKTNGFSICDGESVALGVGLYPSMISAMNHSCNPNAMQTFFYGQSNEPPTLMVTACKGISSAEEICISYIDNACPRSMRRSRLRRDYGFFCMCDFCVDDDHNARSIGLRCPDCQGERISVRGLDDHEIFKCNGCSRRNFQQEFDQLKQYEKEIEKADSIPLLQKAVSECLRLCLGASWYVTDARERLLQILLDNLESNHEIPIQALRVAESLMQSAQPNPHPTLLLKYQIWKYKAAKLRLWSDGRSTPDPRQGIAELQDVQAGIAWLYPSDHELELGLRETLFQASMHMQ